MFLLWLSLGLLAGLAGAGYARVGELEEASVKKTARTCPHCRRPHRDHSICAGRLRGGLSAGRSRSEFDPRALARGARVELEHTSDPRVAERIAMDHLTEDPRYYDKLARIERRS